jgi:hypothetical protein
MTITSTKTPTLIFNNPSQKKKYFGKHKNNNKNNKKLRGGKNYGKKINKIINNIYNIGDKNINNL